MVSNRDSNSVLLVHEVRVLYIVQRRLETF